MGVFKTLFFITAPIVGMTVMAFRLGNRLPYASRLFGNYVGLGYVYFKSLIKFIKPVDQMPFQMISLARKTSQQSQALRRELKSTIKRVREDINAKKRETFENLNQEIKDPELREALNYQQQKVMEKEQRVSSGPLTGSHLIYSILQTRQRLVKQKQQKRESRKFYEEL